MALGYQNPFYLKQAQKKQQSLYDGKVLLEKHDPSVVHDSEETLQLAQEKAAKFVGDFKSLAKEVDESLAKHKALELEIERLLKVVKLENENVELEFQVLNYAKENAHLKTTYKNLFDSISLTRTQTKTIIASLQNKLHNTVYENAKLRAQLFNKVSNQKDNKRVTYNSIPTPQESKVVKNDKVISPRMFRINPFKTSREEKHVSNTVKASAKTKPITVLQSSVFTKKDVNSDSNGLSSTGTDNTKTRRPQSRSNTKNDRVLSASKSSCNKNKGVKVEEHHRTLLLSKNKKHMSSECNNVKRATQNVKSKVVCAMAFKSKHKSKNHEELVFKIFIKVSGRRLLIMSFNVEVNRVCCLLFFFSSFLIDHGHDTADSWRVDPVNSINIELTQSTRLNPGSVKKQTVVANSITKAEYVAASSCCRQIQALVDKKNVIIMEDSIRSDLHFDDAKGTVCLINEANFEGLACIGTMASVIICLADNQKFNFSKYIFDNMVKSLEGGVKFDLFLRFLQVFLDKQVEGMKKQKPRRKQRNEAEVFDDDSEDKDHVLTPSSDPLPSGEDSFILNELMVFCTSLQEQKSETPMEKDSLGAQEDASKQVRMIKEIDQNAKIALDDETQGRKNDDEMFGVDDLAGEEVVMDITTGEHEEQIIEEVITTEPVTTAGEVVTTTVKDSAAPTTDVTEDKITMAQALAALKSIKPKVVVQEQETSTTIPTAATIVTTVVPTPRAKCIIFHKQKQSQIHTVSSSEDKGKAKMIEPKVSIKKKYQMRIDEEYARKLEVKEQEVARLIRAQKTKKLTTLRITYKL
uniref:Uncharacterized protein n=1 Tax=Tanacetum cinerariifolium TaxID=118510 RepID=A0A6L2N1L9_TANCI|nr:hypothetical protein [Tanacetum cinerariifolium]